MLRSQPVRNNALLGGLTVAEDLYAEPEDYDAIFESLEKPSEVIPSQRPTFIRSGVLTTVKGSAYMEYGKTKVLALITPPRELTKSSKRAPQGNINCYVNFAAFATRDLETVPQREKHLSSALRKSLQPMICRNEFAGFQLDVRALVLDDDGCLLSTAINCCGVALVECGISAYDLITSSTVCLYRGVVFVNPDYVIEKLLENDSHRDNSEERGTITTASMATFDQVAECYQTGYMSPESYCKLVDYTLEINKSISETVSHVLVERVKDQYEVELREKAEDALQDQRLTDLIELMQQSNVNKPSSVICGVGVDIFLHGYSAGIFILISSLVVFFIEIKWLITIFLQFLFVNDNYAGCLQCWSCLKFIGGWRPAPLYIAIGVALILWPHNLWLSYVAGMLLILLAILRLCTLFRFSSNAKDEGLLPQCDFEKVDIYPDIPEDDYAEVSPNLEDEEPIDDDDVC